MNRGPITPNRLRTAKRELKRALAEYTEARRAYFSARRERGVASFETAMGADYSALSPLFDQALETRDAWQMERRRVAEFEKRGTKVGAAWSDQGLQNVRKANR